MSAEKPRERPILFNDQMVRAILEGRKTVTRRAVKGFQIPTEDKTTPHEGLRWSALGQRHLRYGFNVFGFTEEECAHELARCGVCPFGKPGDRLWVRETWGVISNTWNESGNMVDWTPDRPATPIRDLPFGSGYYSGHAIYAADGPMEWAGDDDGGGEPRSAWKPSIHMPRAISRILLEITAVRVERLQDISDDQAIAEGIDTHPTGFYGNGCITAGGAFLELWESINGDGKWAANPWVWVIEFKRVAP